MREADERLQAERDRRYAEVNVEKEKALAIKTEADKTALGLQRDVQAYKDEKANNLREQIGSERGTYATQTDLRAAIEKLDATLKPLIDYMSSVQGRDRGIGQSWQGLVGVVALAAVVIDIGSRFINK